MNYVTLIKMKEINTAKHGGARSNAGRKSQGLTTNSKVVRLPSEIYQAYRDGRLARRGCPLFVSKLRAGFPSPADDYVEKSLNIHEYLVQNDATTFFYRMEGLSMIDAGILPDDIVIIDKSLEAKLGDIVLAVVDSHSTLKYLRRSKSGNAILAPANADMQPIEISEGQELQVLGVFIGSFRKAVR